MKNRWRTLDCFDGSATILLVLAKTDAATNFF